MAPALARQLSMAAAPSPAALARQQLLSRERRDPSSSSSSCHHRVPQVGRAFSAALGCPLGPKEVICLVGGRRTRGGRASRICHAALSISLLSRKSSLFRDWRREQQRRPTRKFHVASSVVSEQTAQESDPTPVVEVTEELEEQKLESESESEQQDSEHAYETSSLLEAYRESLLSGDQQSLADISAKLVSVEVERDDLRSQLAGASEEVQNAKERFLRLNADFDNFRKRSEREKASLGDSAKGDVIESLLPILDNFERAKGQLKAETEKEQSIDNSYQGIYRQFVEVLKAIGLRPVQTIGTEFDPSIHEAIMREASAEFADGVVAKEFRKGFVLGERLVRPAMVMVSSGPPPPPQEPQPEEPAPVEVQPVEEQEVQID